MYFYGSRQVISSHMNYYGSSKSKIESFRHFNWKNTPTVTQINISGPKTCGSPVNHLGPKQLTFLPWIVCVNGFVWSNTWDNRYVPKKGWVKCTLVTKLVHHIHFGHGIERLTCYHNYTCSSIRSWSPPMLLLVFCFNGGAWPVHALSWSKAHRVTVFLQLSPFSSFFMFGDALITLLGNWRARVTGGDVIEAGDFVRVRSRTGGGGW